MKSKIVFNQNSISFLSTLTGKKALIVSDPIMEELGYLKAAVEHLGQAGISSEVFTGVKPDPDASVVANGLKKFKNIMPDILVAIGGGSAIDTAKGILYSYWKLDSSDGYEKPLFIAIPSTSGTGSEVTNFSVISTNGEKICIVDDHIVPDIAILDSICIKHVPSRVIADTGMDVIVHCIEAYVSTKATDFSDALIEKAVVLMFENLYALYLDAGNACVRDKIQNASCMAGMAFTNTNLGITHSLAHAFGAEFHISHGRSNALLMNNVMEYNLNLSSEIDTYVAGKLSKLAKLLGLPARTLREGSVNFINEVKKLKKSLKIENRISDLISDKKKWENALENMAQSAINDRCTPTNPRKPTKEDLINIYQRAY